MFGVRSDRSRAFAVPASLKPLAPLLSEVIARRFVFYLGVNNCYVYALCYPSGLPFYVGMGSKNRCFNHLTESERLVLSGVDLAEKNQIVLSLRKANESVWYHFLALTTSRNEAAAIEAYWIDQWGKRSSGGLLTNGVIPESDVEEPSCQPPDIDPSGKEVIKCFQHADIAVAPTYGEFGVSRSGALMFCPFCDEQRLIKVIMKSQRLVCGNCGHYISLKQIRPENGIDHNFFGHEVLKQWRATLTDEETVEAKKHFPNLF